MQSQVIGRQIKDRKFTFSYDHPVMDFNGRLIRVKKDRPEADLKKILFFWDVPQA